jgi:glycosyltransferase involved in cell wall biosynthesis
MQKLSAYILAYNEAEKIADAVASVLWADEIVVADSGSTDATAAIAQGLGARVVQIPFQGFGDLRNRAIAECRYEWIFSLDSDERCTDVVRDEILSILSSPPAHDAYLVPRRNFMMGRWIKGSGWYPNFRQPQLFRKGAMRYRNDPVHEGYELLTKRPLGMLRNAIWQFPFCNLEEVIEKMNRYSSLGARKLAGKRVSMGSALGHGIWVFIKHYLFKCGFRDGWAGFVIALGNFEGTFYRYAKRYEEMRAWSSPQSRADRVVKILYHPAGRQRVLVVQRANGSYGFEEEQLKGEAAAMDWHPVSQGAFSICDSAATAEREARSSVAWLEALGSDVLVKLGPAGAPSPDHASNP